ncbi:hypothetical protein GW17_00028840 [Ensete ventricosum]|nr:hypothetical protein GW17_00028840 [Ensete ventricosum]
MCRVNRAEESVTLWNWRMQGRSKRKKSREAREVTLRWIRKAARERKADAEPMSGASNVAVGGGFLCSVGREHRESRLEGKCWLWAASVAETAGQQSRGGDWFRQRRGVEDDGSECCGWLWSVDLKGSERRKEKSLSAVDGVGKVPLLVGADATVVGHEEDGLVQKDTSAREQQCCLLGVGESYDRRLMELGLSRAEGSNGIVAAKGFSTSFMIEEAEERMVAQVVGPHRATIDKRENRHQQQIVSSIPR